MNPCLTSPEFRYPGLTTSSGWSPWCLLGSNVPNNRIPPYLAQVIFTRGAPSSPLDTDTYAGHLHGCSHPPTWTPSTHTKLPSLYRHPLYLPLGLLTPPPCAPFFVGLLFIFLGFWHIMTFLPAPCQDEYFVLFSLSLDHLEAWQASLRLSGTCQSALLHRHPPHSSWAMAFMQTPPITHRLPHLRSGVFPSLPHFSACLAQPYLLPSNCIAQEGWGKGIENHFWDFLFSFFLAYFMHCLLFYF